MIGFTVAGVPAPQGSSDNGDVMRAIALVIACGGLDYRVTALRMEGEPIAKARARVNRHRHYTPQRTTDAELDIANQIMAAKVEREEGNVAVAAIFYRSNRHRIDTDNLMKTVLDGITKSKAVWPDDSHVTAIVAVTEHDPLWPRTVVAIAPHSSTLTRGTDSLTHTCETCGKRYRPHGPKQTEKSRYCSRACRTTRPSRCICVDCGGPTSVPHVERCRPCSSKNRANS